MEDLVKLVLNGLLTLLNATDVRSLKTWNVDGRKHWECALQLKQDTLVWRIHIVCEDDIFSVEDVRASEAKV
jgi:hypothetical protein